MFGSYSLDTASLGGAVLSPSAASPRDPSMIERLKWQVLAVVRKFGNADIDWFRARYGKAEGEDRFFRENEPDDMILVPGNMLMGNGGSALWQYALGNGTTSANSALGSGPTYINNSQTYLYVGDGGIASGSGTISVTNNTTTVTFGTSQSGLIGSYLTMVGDSTNGFYLVVAGSGTSWTIATPYGGTTLSSSSAGWSHLPAESHSQTALQGSTNVAHQIMDATFPSNPTNANFNVITGATAASPCVLTTSSGDVSLNDIVQVFEINGLSGTGPNGLWVANNGSGGGVNATTISLLGTSTTGSYQSGGIATKRTVAKFQATFGPTAANFPIYEWAIVNGTGGNQIFLNRKVASLGTKNGGTWSVLVGIGIG